MSSDLIKELTEKLRQQIEGDLRKKIRDEILSELAGEMVKGKTAADAAPLRTEFYTEKHNAQNKVLGFLREHAGRYFSNSEIRRAIGVSSGRHIHTDRLAEKGLISGISTYECECETENGACTKEKHVFATVVGKEFLYHPKIIQKYTIKTEGKPLNKSELQREKGSSAGLFKKTSEETTQIERVYQYLKSINEKMVSTAQIVKATNLSSSRVSHDLIELIKRGLAVRIRHGVYMINPVKVVGRVTHIEYNRDDWKKQFPAEKLKKLYPQSLSVLKYMASKPWEPLTQGDAYKKLKVEDHVFRTLVKRGLIKRVKFGIYALPDYKPTGKERRVSDKSDRPVAMFYKDSIVQRIWEHIKANKDRPHNSVSIHLETGIPQNDAMRSLGDLFHQLAVIKLRTGWYAFKTTRDSEIQRLRILSAKMSSVEEGTNRHAVIEAIKTDKSREWTIPEIHMVAKASGNGSSSMTLKDIETELLWLRSMNKVIQPTENTYMARKIFGKNQTVKH